MVALNSFETRTAAGAASARVSAEARLSSLRQKLREVLAQKKARMVEFVETCKADRRAVRDHVREMRTRSLRDLKDQIQAARGAAKLTRLTRLAEVRQVAGSPVDRARSAAAVEKAHQIELARLEREERSRRVEIGRAHERSLAAGALRSALFGKLAPLFEREGRAVKPEPGESLAEARLRFAERNPEKAHAVVEPSVHRKVEDSKRAVEQAERAVRVAGGDVRVGLRAPTAESRGRRDQEKRTAAHGAWPAAGQQRIGSALPVLASKSSPSAREKPALRIVPQSGAALRLPPAATPVGKQKGTAPAEARQPKRGKARPRKTTPTSPKKATRPSGQKWAAKRRKGQVPSEGGGMLLEDLLRERDGITVARTARGKALKPRSAGKGDGALASSPAAAARAMRAKRTEGAAPIASGGAVVAGRTYAAWRELAARAALKHGRRIAFAGKKTEEAWKRGQDAEAFVLMQPGPGQPQVAAPRDLGQQVVSAKNAPRPARATSAVTSTLTESVRPYKVRASCGHIVVRPMRAATAGVPYSEDAVLDAPNGRPCEACEAKQTQKRDFGTHAPKPAAKTANFKAPELNDTAEIAKRIRADIADAVRAKKLSKGKYSVRTSKYSMGSSITVEATLPFPVLNPAAFHLEKGAREVSFNRDCCRSRYTPEADKVLAVLNAIVAAYHWDRSDLMTDYHHSRFHYDVKLNEGNEWQRINDEKRAAAASPRPPVPPPTQSAPVTKRAGRPKRGHGVQQAIDLDSPLFRSLDRSAAPPAANVSSPSAPIRPRLADVQMAAEDASERPQSASTEDQS